MVGFPDGCSQELDGDQAPSRRAGSEESPSDFTFQPEQASPSSNP
jgi:hypothetical protein